MKLIILLAQLIALTTFAETASFEVDGMHCGSCKKILTSKVCDNEKIKSSAESCEVQLVDAKAQKGTLVIVSKAGQTIDRELVKTQVTGAGEYKLTETAAAPAAATASSSSDMSCPHDKKGEAGKSCSHDGKACDGSCKHAGKTCGEKSCSHHDDKSKSCGCHKDKKSKAKSKKASKKKSN